MIEEKAESTINLPDELKPLYDEAKDIDNKVAQILTGDDKYNSDISLGFFASGVEDSMMLIQDLLEKTSLSAKEIEEIKKSHKAILSQYAYLLFRKNLMDGKLEGPQVLKDLDNNFDIAEAFNRHEKQTVVSLGMQPLGLNEPDKEYQWSSGSELDINVINLGEGESFFEYVFKNKKDLPSEDAIVVCKEENADTYFAYLFLTKKIELDEDIANKVIEAIKTGKSSKLYKLAEARDIDGIASFLKIKKKLNSE